MPFSSQLLCIIVENEADVAAFKDFVPTEADNLKIGDTAEPPAPKTPSTPAEAPAAPASVSTNYPSHIVGECVK